jgi:hypothetical protein
MSLPVPSTSLKKRKSEVDIGTHISKKPTTRHVPNHKHEVELFEGERHEHEQLPELDNIHAEPLNIKELTLRLRAQHEAKTDWVEKPIRLKSSAYCCACSGRTVVLKVDTAGRCARCEHRRCVFCESEEQDQVAREMGKRAQETWRQ